MIVLHNTVNAWPGNALAVKNFKRRQISQFNDFEILSTVEPHKLNQRSFTPIRKISGLKKTYIDPMRRDEIEQDARRFLRMTRADLD